MGAQVGQYTFGRHRNLWGIWKNTQVNENVRCAEFVKDVFTYEDVVREVYRLNGWREPKKIYRRF